MLKGKHILLGITGSIAAYKAALLVRLLVKEGAQVRVVMTETAKQFITPLTMATLSKNPILVDFFDPQNGNWNSHISLGMWSDLYLIAPATANTMAKMAHGVADNLLLTTYLSARCPVMVAPAMDVDMFMHPATAESMSILRSRGVSIIEPSSGELASGLDGKGRMEEPENIVLQIKSLFAQSGSCSGKRVIITAGPTKEEMDPVRYISNHSSGKMAYALAESFAERGAKVDVISGPVSLRAQMPTIRVHDVVSAEQMHKKTISLYNEGADVIILCAAVSDFTPAQKNDTKIKREKTGAMSLELLPTQDIAASIGSIKREETIHVGFALETDDEYINAQGKLIRKNLDMIVLNSMKDKGATFGYDTNKVSIIMPNGQMLSFPLKSKREVADDIVDNIEKLFKC